MSATADSSKALDELRRILLTPEALADTLRPLLDELLHERGTELTGVLMEQLTPAIRLAIREALREELRELSTRPIGTLAVGVESTVVQVFRQQIDSRLDTLTGWPCSARQVAGERPADVMADSQAKRLSLGEGAASAEAAPSRGAGGHDRQRRRGWRWLVGLFGVLLGITVGPALFLQSGHSIVGQANVSPAARSAGSASQSPVQMAIAPATPAVFGTPRAEAPTRVIPAMPSQGEPSLPAAAVDGTAPKAAALVVSTEPSALPASAHTGAAGKVLYLTFDDGPNPTWTPQILEVLKQYHAQATFFVVGQQAAQYPDLVQDITDAGHIVGNHTWSHRSFEGMGRAEFEDEVRRTVDSLGPLSGAISPLLRPPYGTISEAGRAWAAELGLQVVKWDIDSRDWAEGPTAEGVSSLVISQAAPGRIVLMHDCGGDREATVAALQIILPTLGQDGYVFRALL